jgi:L-asparaginase II
VAALPHDRPAGRAVGAGQPSGILRVVSSPHSSASPTLTVAPVVAHVVRGGFVESVHHGTAVVTGPDGAIELAVGDPDGAVLPRSSSKPLQALAMVRHGLATDGALLSLACSSHSGEDFHLEGVREILAGAGLSEIDLQNTPDYPYDEAARTAWIAAGSPKQSIAQNCSGKHASMLATCVVNGWDLETYRDPDHPLHAAIIETIADVTGSQPGALAVDGCGAPVHAIPLSALARGFGRLAAATSGPEARVVGAIRGFPEHLGGTTRDVTALVRGIDGIVAKDGAEAVYAVGLADGRGVAVKIADGSPRARSVVLAAVLRRIGLEDPDEPLTVDAFAALERAPVLGHGQPVGSVVAVGI